MMPIGPALNKATRALEVTATVCVATPSTILCYGTVRTAVRYLGNDSQRFVRYVDGGTGFYRKA